jgi:predicted amidophosphoribosyltransferase
MSPSCLTAIRRSVEVLLPQECLICRRPLRGHYLCFRCTPRALELRDIHTSRCMRCFGPYVHSCQSNPACPTCLTFPPLPHRIRFLWEYGGLARDLIRTMKYRPSLKLTRLAGSLMADSLRALFPSACWDIVAPVPSSPATYRKRLFHPCAELARMVVESTPTSTYYDLLRHTSSRSPQALRTHQQRLQRLRTLFSCTGRTSLAGKRILLIEDVITTGATIAAAVSTLHRAGAHEVDVLALAQTPVWRRFRSRIHTIFATS